MTQCSFLPKQPLDDIEKTQASSRLTTSRGLRPKWILGSEEKAKYEMTKPELGKAVTGIQLALTTQGRDAKSLSLDSNRS
jgi:hypothetical protein